jgi:UDP-N-acetylglucosamine 3-dehydrogenase
VTLPRIGVIGFGAIGRHHARNLAARADVQFAGIADTASDAREAATRRGYVAYPSAEALIGSGLDAAIVAVPTSRHESAASVAIERGCAVLVEKPLAHSMQSAKRVVAQAERAGVPLMVGYVERYNPAIRAVRDFIADQRLGQLVNISARRVGLLPPRVKDANVLIDIGVHDIDVVAFVTGARRINLIAARGGMALLHDRLDHATLLLDANGCVVTIEANWITPVKVRELSITGTKGYCRVDYMTQDAWFAPGRSFEPAATYEALVAQYAEGTLLKLPVDKREPLACELDAFVAGLRGAPLPDPRIALASLRLAEEASGAILDAVDAARPVLATRTA